MVSFSGKPIQKQQSLERNSVIFMSVSSILAVSKTECENNMGISVCGCAFSGDLVQCGIFV